MFRFQRLLALLVLATMILAACGQAPQAGTPQTQGNDTAASPAAAPSESTAPAPAASASAQAGDPYGAVQTTSGGAEFHGAFPYKVPPEGHFNSFVPNGIPSLDSISIYWNLLEMPGGMYRWADSTWVPMMAEAWETRAPDTFVVNLRQGAKWSDGSDFTARDVVTTFNMGRLFKWTVFAYVDTVTATDDHTVEFHMSKPSTAVERYVLGERYRAASTYGELGDKVAQLVADGKNEESDEWKALVQEATDFRPTDLVVTGPYKLDVSTITEAQLSLSKNPTSWLADKAQFDKIVIYNGETPAVTPLVLAGDVDYATHGFPPATEKAFQDQQVRIIRAPTYSGPAIYFNHDLYPLSRYEVRQAIAHAVNRQENGTVALGESGVAVKSMAGFSDNLLPQWLTEQQISELDTYDYDVQKAEEILTGIGFKRDTDGVWIDDQGKRMEFELTAPAEFADWSAAAENLGQQLTTFGIKATVRGVQFQQHLSDVNKGNFQMAIRGWGIGSNPHPHFSYRQDLFTHNYVASTEGKGMNFQMQQTIDGEEIDFEKLVVESADGLDTDAQKEKVAAIAQAFNKTLPVVPLWERYGNNPARDTRVTGWPDDSDPLYKNAVYGDNFVTMMLLDGTLKPKQ